MDKLLITGGAPLYGSIIIGGAKNAALPLMCATLLTDKVVTLDNVPYLADITTMAKLLMQHGSTLSVQDSGSGDLFAQNRESGHYSRRLTLHAPSITSITAPYDLVRTMRASVLVLGPILAREGRAKVSLPGGCAIGTRPIDLHLYAMERLGATIRLEEGYVIAEAPAGGLVGNEIIFEKVSVGATENALMAATLARGTTIIRNAAREPEIGDLAELLNAMGAQITGIDSDTLTIHGVNSLDGTEHRVIADRIETGTYLCAVGLAGGELTLQHARPDTLLNVIEVIRAIGIHVEHEGDTIRVSHQRGAPLHPASLTTAPHPDFPTDMQAQVMTLLTQALGNSPISETIFENRFMHVPELARMGANITVEGHTAIVHGATALKGAPVMATDLRASVSLVIAALAAEGETAVNRIYHLDRGYERLEEKLTACGANIRRVR
jgi:UDP-N-acetylglucosamine 1-carboxyvinyltransferase